MPKRVLCVDEDSDVSGLIRLILKGHQVISEHGLENAYRRFSREKFDLILIDFRLSDGTGFELCNCIRLSDRTTPILFITGSPWITGAPWITEEEALHVGAQGLIHKHSKDFVARLRTAANTLMENKKPGFSYIELRAIG